MSDPTSSSVLLSVTLGLLGLGALTVVGLSARRRLRRRAAARAAARTAVDRMTDAFLALHDARRFVQPRVQALPRVDDVTVRGIIAMYAATADRIGAATTACLQLGERYDARALARIGTEDAAVAERAVRGAAERLGGLRRELQNVEAELDELDSLRAELPRRAAAVREVALEAGRLLPERRQQGFFVDAHAERLSGIEVSCAEAEQLLSQARVAAAAAVLDEASATAQALYADLEGLPGRQEQLRTCLEDLRASRKRCGLLLRGALGLTERLEATRHPSCTQDLRALVSEAGAALAGIPALLAELDRTSSMQVQDLEAAEAVADQVRQTLADIETACCAPVRRRDDLTEKGTRPAATRDAGSEVSPGGSSAGRARAGIHGRGSAGF